MYCKNCGVEMPDAAIFCPACGYRQVAEGTATAAPQTGQTPAIVIVLCVFTILGSVGGIVRGLFYETIANIGSNTEYWRGYAFALVNIGTLVGAIMMLMRKLNGYYIYVVFQVSYIALVLYTTFFYTHMVTGTGDNVDTSLSTVAALIASMFLIPSVVLLVLFVTLARKHFQ